MYVCEDDVETQIMKNRDIRKMHPILGLSCINLVVKAIVVRKSLGPKGPCGFDSHRAHNADVAEW